MASGPGTPDMYVYVHVYVYIYVSMLFSLLSLTNSSLSFSLSLAISRLVFLLRILRRKISLEREDLERLRR